MTNKKIDYLDRKGIIDITKLEPAKEGPTTKFRDSDGEKYFRFLAGGRKFNASNGD